MIKKKINSVTYTAILVIVFTVIYFLEGLRVAPPLTKYRTIGVSFFPLTIASILIILSVFLLMNSFKKKKNYIFKLARIGNPLQVIVLTVIYSLFFEKIGFFISTIIYVFFVIIIFEEKKNNKIRFFVYSLVISLLVYLLFEKAFNVRLPSVL